MSTPALDISPEELQDIFELPSEDKGYRLIALDDDRTLALYVVELFMAVLELSGKEAFELMKQIHFGGRAEIFKGSFEECQHKHEQIQQANRIHGQNLFTFVERIA